MGEAVQVRTGVATEPWNTITVGHPPAGAVPLGTCHNTSRASPAAWSVVVRYGHVSTTPFVEQTELAGTAEGAHPARTPDNARPAATIAAARRRDARPTCEILFPTAICTPWSMLRSP